MTGQCPLDDTGDTLMSPDTCVTRYLCHQILVCVCVCVCVRTYVCVLNYHYEFVI